MLNIQENISLARYTTFRIGGSAKYFVEVATTEELKEALNHAKSNDLKFFILGGGSNLLVNDAGFDGLIIKMKLNEFKIVGNSVEAGSGVALAKVVNSSINENLSGMEWAAGIPGTVGGAVRGNAGAYGRCSGDVIESVKVLLLDENMEIKEISNSDCEFFYRGSFFKKNPKTVIISAKFKLEKGNKEKSQQEIKERLLKRVAGQPQGSSAGSFFLNPVVDSQDLREKFEKDQDKKCKDEKLPAGWLIDQTGLRGKKISGAMISEQHTNYIVNTGNATAKDIIMLASLVKQQVRDKFGIQLHEEVQMLGF